MFEENSVTTAAENEITPVDAGDGYSTDELDSGDDQQEALEQTVEQGVDSQPQGGEQKDIGKAFAAERRRIEERERARYDQMRQSDPAFLAGERLLNDIMRMRGIGREEAAKIAEQGFIRALAEREGVSEYVARSMLAQHHAQQQPQQQMDANSRAAQIRQEIAQMDMPEGFDFNESVKDQAFVQMLMDYPVKAAVQMYHMQKQLEQANQTASQAPQVVADKLRARQAIPQPMKLQQPVTPQKDFASMTSEEFFKWEREHNL